MTKAQLIRRLKQVTAKIGTAEGLYAERTELFIKLADEGMTMREIGELAGVTDRAVSKAILASRARATV